jgi:hypothetical protein
MVAGLPEEGAGLESRKVLPMCKRAAARGDVLGVRRCASASGWSEMSSLESDEMGGR